MLADYTFVYCACRHANRLRQSVCKLLMSSHVKSCQVRCSHKLLGDELLGDELLGDELLGDELLGDELLGALLLPEGGGREKCRVPRYARPPQPKISGLKFNVYTFV